jgi:hypothetical protein
MPEENRSFLVSWFRPVCAAGLAVLLLSGGLWWQAAHRMDGSNPIVAVVPAPERKSADPLVEEWQMPTDSLLADAGDAAARRETARLCLEIDALLQR